MKSRKPKKIESNNSKPENDIPVIHVLTLEEALEAVEKNFYNFIDEYGNQSILQIVQQMLRTSFLSGQLGIVRFHHRDVSKKILELFESELVKLIEQQYNSQLKSQDTAACLGLLVSVNKPKFLQNILDLDYSNKMKSSLKNAVDTFTERKLKELDTSREDFQQIFDYATQALPVSDNQDIIPEKKETLQEETESNKASIESEPPIEKEPNANTQPEQPKTRTFFEQVSDYTNNFQYLVPTDISTRLKEHKLGKFSTVTDYYKYDTFQAKLKDYMIMNRKTELQTIQSILSNQKVFAEFEKIDPDFEKILLARKNVILKKQASLEESK